MAAQSIERPRTKNTKTRNNRTPKQDAIIAICTQNPNLTTREAGKLANADHTTVIRTLARFNIEQAEIDGYKSNRADIFAGTQQRILTACTDDDIKKASLLQKVTAASILYDKERLERGQTTGNIGVGIALSRPLQESIDAIINRKATDMGVSLGVSPAAATTNNEPIQDITPPI